MGGNNETADASADAEVRPFAPSSVARDVQEEILKLVQKQVSAELCKLSLRLAATEPSDKANKCDGGAQKLEETPKFDDLCASDPEKSSKEELLDENVTLVVQKKEVEAKSVVGGEEGALGIAREKQLDLLPYASVETFLKSLESGSGDMHFVMDTKVKLMHISFTGPKHQSFPEVFLIDLEDLSEGTEKTLSALRHKFWNSVVFSRTTSNNNGFIPAVPREALVRALRTLEKIQPTASVALQTCEASIRLLKTGVFEPVTRFYDLAVDPKTLFYDTKLNVHSLESQYVGMTAAELTEKLLAETDAPVEYFQNSCSTDGKWVSRLEFQEAYPQLFKAKHWSCLFEVHRTRNVCLYTTKVASPLVFRALFTGQNVDQVVHLLQRKV